eukprot:COSAG06_NODE_19745_length_824_cov_0.962759_1_plen_76_part_10
MHPGIRIENNLYSYASLRARDVVARPGSCAAAAPSDERRAGRPRRSGCSSRGVQDSENNVQRAQTTLQGTAPADTG